MSKPALKAVEAAGHDPSRWFGYLLNQGAMRVRTLTADALAPLGLTPVLLRALAAVSESDAPTQVRLGQLLGMDRTTTSQMIDRLEAMGFVRRTPDPTDRRSHMLRMTREGDAALAVAERRAETAQETFLAPLSATERAALSRLLRKLHRPVACPAEPAPPPAPGTPGTKDSR